MSQALSWVQFSQWVQHGFSAVPAAGAQARVRHREAVSPKLSTRRRSEAQSQCSLLICGFMFAQRITDATRGKHGRPTPLVYKPFVMNANSCLQAIVTGSLPSAPGTVMVHGAAKGA